MRNRRLDGHSDRVEVVGHVAGREGGACRHHATADVHANGGRDNRSHRWNDATDGRAHAPVNVGHHRDVMMDERHPRHVLKLCQSLIFDLHSFRPSENGDVFFA